MASGKKNCFRHYLYVIGEDADEYCGSYSGYIKIGISAQPKDRIKSLRCANPRALTFLAIYGFEHKFQAVVFECGLHNMLNTHRARNEWFYYNKYTKKWIEKIKSASFNDVIEFFND